jgi:hypothetical protein
MKTFTRKILQQLPDHLFAFGDNMKRTGFGGQAAECRGEPNAVGIPTKWLPAKHPAAFFCDGDLLEAKQPIDDAFERLEQHLRDGKVVVWPLHGIGTGLANLKNCAPQVMAYIEARYERLMRIGQDPVPALTKESPNG